MAPHKKDETTDKTPVTTSTSIATKTGAAHCASSIHLNLPVKKVCLVDSFIVIK